MSKPPYKDQKEQYLRDHGILNKGPERVRDELFLTNEFFDPRDLLQVRYEMIRRHRVDKVNVKETARSFGFSRPVFYELKAKFEEKGLNGLLPEKPGPRGPTKCVEEILDFVQEKRLQEPALDMEDIILEVSQEFGVKLHQRTIERGIARRKKKGRRQKRP